MEGSVGGADFMPEFMEKKNKVQYNLQQIRAHCTVIKEIIIKYKNATDEHTESKFLENMNSLNDKNSQLLRDSNKVMSQMKTENKRYKYNDALKDEPEARIMNALCNGLDTQIYEMLKLSQNIQMDIKVASKEKITRHVMNVEPNMSKRKVAAIVDDPQEVAKLVQRKMGGSMPNEMKNAINDINEKYKELSKLEKNVKE